jgi:hypothetical protein
MDRKLCSELIMDIYELFEKYGINCENCKHYKTQPKGCISPLTKEPCLFKRTNPLMFEKREDNGSR